MRNRIVTISIREIKKSLKRFLSLMAISMLGVGVFSGIKATSPDMIKSLDNYYDDNNIYDIRLASFQGFTQEEIDSLKDIEGIESIEGNRIMPLEVTGEETSFVVNFHEMSDEINKIVLTEGRLPENTDEIVVERTMLTAENLHIGDRIMLKDNQMLADTEMKIVGVADSAYYIGNNENRHNIGNTTLGTGTINYYVYGMEGQLLIPYYTDVFITADGAKEHLTDSKQYISLIEDVKNKIPDTYMTYDRRDDESYAGYINDANSISNLAKLFPTLFFIISVFVSLVSMSRMVDDDRMEIGTLKSMGFSNIHISFKYMIYAIIATLAGGIIGASAGFLVIPNIIWNIYKILFNIPKLVLAYDMTNIIKGICISFVCICGATLITVWKNLKENPAKLMRPKAPKKGKRVLLEYVTFIWKRIKFSGKVTVRNIFRYKSRVFMTIIGVAGCTALLMAGFGLRDAIINIPEKQYKELFTYNDMVYFRADITEDEIDSVLDDENIQNTAKTCFSTFESTGYDKNISITVISPNSNEEFEDIFNLYDVNSKKELSLSEGSVIISDKMSEILNVSKGDSLNISDSLGNKYTFTIGAVCEHYVGHYMYISKQDYEKNIGGYRINTAFFSTDNITESVQEKLSEKILVNPNVLQVVVIDNVIKNVEDMLTSLNYVIMILLVLAGTLSFVVMYNLSNINISERKREVATLKVLGFYDGEVDNYIIKENIILTLIGIAAGLVLGYVFTNIIVSTVEIESVRFVHHIKVLSYILSSVLALIFTLCVNIITHFSLKKIDMIESLKSVE